MQTLEGGQGQQGLLMHRFVKEHTTQHTPSWRLTPSNTQPVYEDTSAPTHMCSQTHRRVYLTAEPPGEEQSCSVPICLRVSQTVPLSGVIFIHASLSLNLQLM